MHEQHNNKKKEKTLTDALPIGVAFVLQDEVLNTAGADEVLVDDGVGDKVSDSDAFLAGVAEVHSTDRHPGERRLDTVHLFGLPGAYDIS